MTNPTVAALVERSNRLGRDPKNTNYAGGNTSAKGTETDPVTGEDVELVWVKGSGGDLGTLTEKGLAVLRLDRMRALAGVYPGVDREDEMVAVARAQIRTGLGDADDRLARLQLLERQAEVEIALEIERGHVDIVGIVEPRAAAQLGGGRTGH